MEMNRKQGFLLNEEAGYFQNHGVDVMAFSDFYPAGHQSGVTVLMHGKRVCTNGDLRFEQTPGQWQPLPKQGERKLDKENNAISTKLHYPDMQYHLSGFNPMIYPDFEFDYTVTVQGVGDSVEVRVDLSSSIPEKYVGKMCFNMELFPGELFGKPWIMDQKQGVFPRQPGGPVLEMPTNYDHTGSWQPQTDHPAIREQLSGDKREYNPIIADDLIATPYAVGRRFTVRPDDALSCFTVETKTCDLKLYDGRMNHNNGWFVISSEIPAGVTENALHWVISPKIDPQWRYTPVVQLSQVGYAPRQKKMAIVELDNRDEARYPIRLERITENGAETVLEKQPEDWGKFLRYHYLRFDFSEITAEGLYRVVYGNSQSSVVRIAQDVYDRGVWQPVLEYFLPVQMCHMRVNEKYRVWHGLCHNDDARMAPVNFTHFDGYFQGPSTLCKYQPGDHVPGLNVGGWHDAGDFDLRVESQAGESYILSLAYESFHLDYDATTIDQSRKLVEIHQPDGKNDLLQQIEHGALTVVAGYKALGRLYRGIICNDLRQYVLLGDPASMTDSIPGNEDDRWVFTEDNPFRELNTAGHLAAVSRVLRGFNDELSADALAAAQELFDVTDSTRNDFARGAKIFAATELLLTTGEEKYKAHILSEKEFISEKIKMLGWNVARVIEKIDDAAFTAFFRQCLVALRDEMVALSAETPYGIPYRPHIWGAGWEVQRLGYQYYFLHKHFPDIFDPELIFSSLNFVLGCHPGSNTASFASGVGAESATMAYGFNRGDFSYVPGGVVSGTALIRPDFPELLRWPFLWQQTEYVLGGGSSCYMFLVLAVKQLLEG